MASNLLELRKAAGYKNASDFAEAHEIPASTYARYESNPDKIPMDRAWQLADILGTTIDAIVDREAPAPGTARGEVQLEYDGLTPEARALADELREFVLMKDEKIRARRRREEERPYEALCYQYEQQMLSQMRDGAAFGELVAFESAEAARSAFESFLQEQAAKKRGRLSTKAEKVIDDMTIEKIMAAYDRTHGEYDSEGMHVLWSSVDHGVLVEYDALADGGDGGAKA
ncbi:helix-turn-helix transcriptional regulator [Tractidigestivibacter sp.]|uniref:helix-turn-helix domain-containing protein n=1 Tax=Tractidigestivibacter sp. TaxID=2847320 RepID=UPI002A9136D3|nr:helix-turn-helix transcriptional regulator [Tractidigestivibacter sp.]MDY5271661.1 helix-turn-helix transcriptional regulator [Tractidigestivibacter sp.]